MIDKFEVPDFSEIPLTEVCPKEYCGHTLEEHDVYRCRGLDPTHREGICGCEQFDDRPFVARRAMIYALKQLKGASKYDVRTLDEAHNWLDNEIYLLENPERAPSKKRKH